MYAPPGNRIQLPCEHDLPPGTPQAIVPVQGIAKVSSIPLRVALMSSTRVSSFWGTLGGPSIQYSRTGKTGDLMCSGTGPFLLVELSIGQLYGSGSYTYPVVIAMAPDSSYAIAVVKKTGTAIILRPVNGTNWGIVNTQTLPYQLDKVFITEDEIIISDNSPSILTYNLVGNTLVWKKTVSTAAYPEHRNVSILNKDFGVLGSDTEFQSRPLLLIRINDTWTLSTPPNHMASFYNFVLSGDGRRGVCVSTYANGLYPFILEGGTVNVDISNGVPSPYQYERVSDICFKPGTNQFIVAYLSGISLDSAILVADKFLGAIPEEVYGSTISTSLVGVR
jgi:hypothetical protein